jgi:flagellar hook-basal body complex protein FliE
MSIPAIGAVSGFTPMVAQTLSTTGVDPTQAANAATSTTSAASAGGADFGHILSQGLQNLQGLQAKADQLRVQAATGDLNAIHDYTITATETAVATQLTTAVRNKALEAFQSIMQMQV